MTNLDSVLKSREITLPTKVHLVKAILFPVIMCGCESWTIKKTERRRIDAFIFIYLFLDSVFIYLFIFPFIFIRWRLITLQYCSGFTWISHGFTCVPHPDPPSRLPLHPILLGLPSTPALSTCLMHHSAVYNCQDMEATSMPISRQMDKEAMVHIHYGILLSH